MHKNGGEQLLNVPAIVLANLCVSYIMTSQNEAAEELMRKIEKEEECLAFPDQRSVHHLCIVNLVIGTLYCAKGNFEFGIARIVKSLEPYDKKLGADTWYVDDPLSKHCSFEILAQMSDLTFRHHHVVLTTRRNRYYAKRCFLALAENLGKHLVTLKDASLFEILEFLDAAELHGSKIKAVSTALPGGGDGGARLGKRSKGTGTQNTVSYEARQLKCLFIKLME